MKSLSTRGLTPTVSVPRERVWFIDWKSVWPGGLALSHKHTHPVSVCSCWFGMRKFTLRHMNMNYGGFWQGENRNFGLRPPKLLGGAFTVCDDRFDGIWVLGGGRLIVWHISAGIVLYRRDGFRAILGKPLQFSNKLVPPCAKRVEATNLVRNMSQKLSLSFPV